MGRNPSRNRQRCLMAKPEWGVKRSCPSCGARFYDLQNDPIVCPSCGAPHDLSQPQADDAPALGLQLPGALVDGDRRRGLQAAHVEVQAGMRWETLAHRQT